MINKLTSKAEKLAKETAFSLGANIRSARVNRILTQQEVASACNLGIGTYTKIEKGELTVSVGAYIAVLIYLGIAAQLKYVGSAADDQNRSTRKTRSRKIKR